MSEWKKYLRNNVAEMRPVTEADEYNFKMKGRLNAFVDDKKIVISISEADLNAGSPKVGDQIARNPVNHLDQWLVAADYFNDNFEELIEK